MNITSLGKGRALVSIPYTPGRNEAAGGLYGVYVDAEGNAVRIADSVYDANRSCVIFTTGHFSVYGVGYTAPTKKYKDISTHWSKEAIDYVTGRGLLTGISETSFAPDAAMTLQRAGVVMGEKSNRFNPKAEATRAEVSAMLYRYIKLTITPATDCGWSRDDDGQWYYFYEDGTLARSTKVGGYEVDGNGVRKTKQIRKDKDNREKSGESREHGACLLITERAGSCFIVLRDCKN